jgi:hypothetical protein
MQKEHKDETNIIKKDKSDDFIIMIQINSVTAFSEILMLNG